MIARSLLATGLLCGLLAGPVTSALAAGDPVLVLGNQPETLDPYNTNTTLTTAVTKSFYEGLFEFDKDLKVRNVLAESYEVSPDGLIYTFKLREGVKFHDGTAFDANAVKTNLERVLNPENHLARYNQFNRVKTVEAVSPGVVRITLKEPFGPFINSLAHASAAMISPAALQKWGKDIAFHPVGTGPFTFVEWKQTDSVKGAKFAGYWHAGLPKVDSITWKPVPENGTRAAMLQTGEADFAFPLPYEQAKALGENKKLKVIAQDSIILRYLSMNMLQKPFDDLRVRQAINYAINKEALAKVAFSGYASPAKGVVPAGVLYAHPMAAWPYDPAKARQLLKEAGYPNGFETILWSGYTTSTAQKAIQFLQQQLAQVGIKVQTQALEPGQRVEWVQTAPDPKTARVRLYYIGWSSSTGEADWALRPLLSTEAWPPKLSNTAYYSNPEVDALLAKALVTTSDAEKADLYAKAQEQIVKDAPWAPLVTEQNLYATSARLSGVAVMPDGNIDSRQVAVAP
ncbi:glutathione ABC transporter substrate-binding protein GsiB [Methylobacterium platani]|uniref:Glutathione-binding protein GsiB n=2 Tax=Methylobacterium platani TaxID=427683 RepID=A0A179RYS7_9HYPH|nr:glutathione ABC transporter substrate-binding protein GsiB [Methylobacterium platani]KMO10725.1 glutathione ABC transporter substrate-binding protein [Methylobacterium platani JCM 14648]OAS15864.1 glutathione ABC transporter substrate-binding protein GsiB [Methylobacterium platani]